MTNQRTNKPNPSARDSSHQSRSVVIPKKASSVNASERADTSDFFAARQAESIEQEVLVRKRKRRNAKKKKSFRVAAIVAAALVLVVGGTAFGITSSIEAGEKAVHQAAQAADIQAAENVITYDEGKTVKHNGHTYVLNTNMVSICVLGFDRAAPAEAGETAGQADAVLIMALDTNTGKITAIGIPRDSMVEVGEFVGDAFIGLDKMQLCLAYSYGDGKETSCEYTVAAATRVLYNMPMSYYFAIDLSGVGPLNDSIGGVALTPLQTIPNTNIVEGDPTTLFGDNALHYMQWRDSSVLTSSLDRQARQVQYFKTFASQALAAAQGNIGTLLDLFNTASAYSITNLGVNEFSYLSTSVLSNGVASLDVVTLPGTMEQGEKYAEYYLDKNAVYETVLNVYYNQVD